MHSNTKKVWLVIAAVILTSGCVAPNLARAPVDPAKLEREKNLQKKIAMQAAIARQLEIERVARPLWVKNASYCGDSTVYSIWARASVISEFDDPVMLQIMVGDYQVSDDLAFTFITPGGPVDAAGGKTGDRIFRIDGVEPRSHSAKEMLASAVQSGRPFSLAVLRPAGTQLVPVNLVVRPELSCSYGIKYREGPAINAFADGAAVYITAGMLRFTETDNELAIVLAHELGHNVQRHIDAARSNAALGSVFDILAAAYGVNTRGAFAQMGRQAYSQDFEAEADTWGVYAMARAGLPIDGVPHFWRRMAAENPGSIDGSYGSTHPSPPERFLGLEHNVREIQTLKAKGAPLHPRSSNPGSFASSAQSSNAPPNQQRVQERESRIPRRR